MHHHGEGAKAIGVELVEEDLEAIGCTSFLVFPDGTQPVLPQSLATQTVGCDLLEQR